MFIWQYNIFIQLFVSMPTLIDLGSAIMSALYSYTEQPKGDVSIRILVENHCREAQMAGVV